MTKWSVGTRLRHSFNAELGPGRVVEVEGRRIVVEFPASGTKLRLAADTDALVALDFPVGARVTVEGSESIETVAEDLGNQRVRLGNGVEIETSSLWPVDQGETLFDRLARGDVDDFADFSNRIDALHLAELREADGLGSFLGGRISLFAHQLHAAERATRSDPVRWLLADEVGLGKTVEACLILNHLLRKQRARRALVVAPETLTVQWLGELWRKYHQVFVLLDEKRRQDVVREHGEGFNPFEAHDRMVISLETLVEDPALAAAAAAAEIDFLVVDEAHHLRRPLGHPGNPAYRAIAPLTTAARHVLLLTATPLEDDATGFFRLLQLLRPEDFPEDESFEKRLAAKKPLPPCTSSARRADLASLPPRSPQPVDLPLSAGMSRALAEEEAIRMEAATDALARKRKVEALVRCLSRGPGMEADARMEWLAQEAPHWREAGDKTLVFVAERETLEAIRKEMSRRVQLRTGVFHEDLSAGQRDIEVAHFRLPSGPSLLISTECGGEGRNFQFCRRLVLFDLPWSPGVVEQRIGRLDRIGRDRPVEIIYFRPPGGLGAAVAEFYERIGLFRTPLAGLSRELERVEQTIHHLATSTVGPISSESFDAVIDEARDARSRVQEAAYHELHRDPYRAQMEETILSRIPADLEELTEEVVTAAAERLHLYAEPLGDGERWSFEVGTSARVESLPGVPGGSSFLGTFKRELAVERETEDFFASGHPLVEGLLAELEDSRRGRVGLIHLDGAEGEVGFGLAAFFRRGSRLQVRVVDLNGRERNEWADLVKCRPLRSKKVKADSWVAQKGWANAVRRLESYFDPSETPAAIAALRIGK